MTLLADDTLPAEFPKVEGRRSIKYFINCDALSVEYHVFAENEFDAAAKAHKFLEIPDEMDIKVRRDTSVSDGFMIKGVQPKVT